MSSLVRAKSLKIEQFASRHACSNEKKREKNRLFNQISRNVVTACLFGLFLFPYLLPVHTAPIPSFYSEWTAAMLVLLACLFSFPIKGQDCSVAPVPLIASIFLLSILVLVVQSHLQRPTYFYNAWIPMLYLLGAAAATMLGSAAAREIGLRPLLRWISLAAVVGGSVSVCIQVAQLFEIESVFAPFVSMHAEKATFFSANLAQKNQLTTYIGWSLVGALYLYSQRHLSTLAVVAQVAFLMLGLALAGSRMSWLIVIWIGMAAVFLVSHRSSPPHARHRYLVLAIPLLYLAINQALPGIGQIVGFEFGQSSLGRIQGEKVDAARLLIYAQAWEIFLQHPVLGVGPGEFAFHQFLLMDQFDKTVLASSAHNMILDLLVTVGLLGTAIVVVGLGHWLWRTRSGFGSPEYAVILAMLGVLGIHTMLEYPHWYGYFLWPAAFFMGCLETRYLSLARGRLLASMPLATVLVLFIFCIFLYPQYRGIEAVNALVNKGMSVPKHDLYGAETTSLINVYNKTFFTPYAETLLAAHVDLDAHELQSKLEFAERAVRFSVFPKIVFRQIIWLSLAGRHDEAFINLIRLVKTHPKDFPVIAKDIDKFAQADPLRFGILSARLKEWSRAQEQLARTSGGLPQPIP